MTMQTNSLPFQVAGANAPGAANNAGNGARTSSSDKLAANANGGFGATLSRELAQRQPATQPGAPTPPPAPTAAPPAKPAQQNVKPAPADKPAPREPAHASASRPAAESTQKSAQAGAKTTSEEADAASSAAAEAAEAATTPVTDMLAFMASLQQPAAAVATVASDAAAVAGSAVQAQLTALENAMQNLKGSATGVADDAAVSAAPGDDSGAGLKLASGIVPDAVDAVASQKGSALPEGQQDAAAFGAQLRDAKQSTPAAAEESAPPLAALQAQAAKLAEVQGPATSGDRIPARVGTQAWDNQVSQRIVYMVGKEQAATLTLNPPDLGPVQVVLSVSNDQATVAFSSQQLEVRQALENAMPRLREMMSESGIALGNATVDAGNPNQQGSQDNGRRANGGAQGSPDGLAGNGQGEPGLNEVAPRATRTVAIGDGGMVDLFA